MSVAVLDSVEDAQSIKVVPDKSKKIGGDEAEVVVQGPTAQRLDKYDVRKMVVAYAETELKMYDPGLSNAFQIIPGFFSKDGRELGAPSAGYEVRGKYQVTAGRR